MMLTYKTFKEMVAYIKDIYSPEWHPTYSMEGFFASCQDRIPDELAMPMLNIYCDRCSRGPSSGDDILSAVIEEIKETYEDYFQDLIHSDNEA